MKEGWLNRSFVECLKKVPKQKAVKSKDYLDEGLYPIVSQESGLISGYSNSEELLYKHDRSVVIFGDHTKNVKYVDFDFVVGADGVHILDPKDDILPKFFYYELCSIKLRNLGYARHYKLLKEKQIYYPSLTEQERIVSYLDAEFAKIDALKTNTEQQLQAAKDLFQSALQKYLTPKEGWTNGIMGDIATILHGKNQKEVADDNGLYPIYGSGGNIMGYSREYLCEEGTTILGRKGTINNPMYIGEKFWNVDTAFGICAKDGIDKRFLYYLVKSEDWQKRNTGTTLPSLTQTVVLSVSISYPSLKEQRDIVVILDTLSDKVARLQENYNKTITLCNDLKQSLLKSIFE